MKLDSSKVAQRLSDIEPFRVVQVLERARQLAATGRDIVHLEVGEPDFPTAPAIVAAAKNALDAGATKYSSANGISELRLAIAGYYQAEYGVEVDPARIMLTPGASGALTLLAALLVDPGDNMLMTDPGYPCNRHFLRLVEGEGRLIPVDADDGFQLSHRHIERYWDERTIGALVASPANPTGATLGRQSLQALFEAVSERDGQLLVDEIYHGFSFDDDVPTALAISENIFVINSFSKFFGLTGWRLGWLVAPAWAVPHLEKLAQNLFISMSTMAQHAALACFLPETMDLLRERRDIFRQRRDYLVPALKELGFSVPMDPHGGFYVYADISKFSNDSQAFCLEMLEQHGVAITPGADFGRYQANTHVRFAYTTAMERLELAIDRMKKALE
ncbi:pyridoxal phosphate-dependent aminotransferase [bacterium]|nr:pyridoxal phosphate-dependent aminotransferase [bacterium]